MVPYHDVQGYMLCGGIMEHCVEEKALSMHVVLSFDLV